MERVRKRRQFTEKMEEEVSKILPLVLCEIVLNYAKTELCFFETTSSGEGLLIDPFSGRAISDKCFRSKHYPENAALVNGKWWYPIHLVGTQWIVLRSEVCDPNKKEIEIQEDRYRISSSAYRSVNVGFGGQFSNLYFHFETNSVYFLLELPAPGCESYLYCFSFQTRQWKEYFLGDAITPFCLNILGITHSKTKPWLVCGNRFAVTRRFFLVPIEKYSCQIETIELCLPGKMCSFSSVTDTNIWFLCSDPQDSGVWKLATLAFRNKKEEEEQKEISLDSFEVKQVLKLKLDSAHVLKVSLHLLNNVPTLVRQRDDWAETFEGIKDLGVKVKVADCGDYFFLETNASCFAVEH
jgi:hypothetical protein